MSKERFEALSKICLNNWHYITRKVLSFHEEINFFTGHSGSGKSTIIDALQIILYANTDGRAFFNKAAADDSDRNLIEYLRGMVNIGEDNEFSYLRNHNFSTTIVLELEQTDSKEKQCVGIVFDVDTNSNGFSRQFFWHKGGLLEHHYRTQGRAMTIQEVKKYLKQNFSDLEYKTYSTNESFRKDLYSRYLGGLDKEKFPMLFKKAIPFRMNMKIEDFVKEYICMEQNIEIEAMQESVMQYGRMRKKIEDTTLEIKELTKIKEVYQELEAANYEVNKAQYFVKNLEILGLKTAIQSLVEKMKNNSEDLLVIKKEKEQVQSLISQLKQQRDDLIKQIHETGYEGLLKELSSVNELIENYSKEIAKWQRTAHGLKSWEEQEMVSNTTIWDIQKFQNNSITREEMVRLQRAIAEYCKEVQEQKNDANVQITRLTKDIRKFEGELAQLKLGKKAYPKELEEARLYIKRRLDEQNKKPVVVEVLADLLDIKDDTWRNAIEGYLGNHKLTLVVKPEYARQALEIYQKMDKEKFYKVTVLDTEKVNEQNFVVKEQALSKEVITKESYIQKYIDLLLGKVIKCENVEELRKQKIGITPDCMLYHSFRLQHIDPKNYRNRAYIGEQGVKRRIKELEKQLQKLEVDRKPLIEIQVACENILKLEKFDGDIQEYLDWQKAFELVKNKEKEKCLLEDKINELKAKDVDGLQILKTQVEKMLKAKEENEKELEKKDWDLESKSKENNDKRIFMEEQLVVQERRQREEEETLDEKQRLTRSEYQKELERVLKQYRNPRYELLKIQYDNSLGKLLEKVNLKQETLQNIRHSYLMNYQNRNFSPTQKDNAPYDDLLEKLQCNELEIFHKKATQLAKEAIVCFKNDFMYKIRSAIKDAKIRKDELNRVISRLNFGKDQYQFVIGKNKGVDGRFYDMFMDEALEVQPSQMLDHMDNQINLFTMGHENKYNELINELIYFFIPPDNATLEELELAKRNMDRYADYRTYLSFDMQQTIHGKETIKIQLSKMIKKNSGGEGQNPLYVALLASFAQTYRISLSPNILRNPTIRLVVLDEAFSKMDAEKVASCIELIRKLGFQAIISATNDKIQNYLENVDKTFVFANPNKKCISIQEFEKKEFGVLSQED